ncbi:MAG: transposase [Deltaproteobacteria bacterium]|jgi:hypothetical protein|nr:transposase [Deltaproteobacteria bacterium]
MSSGSKMKVALPTKGVAIRKNQKYATVFKVVRVAKNEKGTPTNERVAIGRLDETGSMLVPNKNYWSFYPNGNIEILPRHNSIRSVGVAFLVDHILEYLGLKKMLLNTFGESRAEHIHAAVLHMTSRGNGFTKISDFFEEYSLYEPPLDSPKASALFASITYDERMRFFKKWIAKHKADYYWACDVRSFSTDSEKIQDAVMDDDRRNEKLAQINLGCFISQDSGLPVYYATYPGPITDKSQLPDMTSHNAEFNAKNLLFALDRDFGATDNLKFMNENGYSYVLGGKLSQKTILSAVDSSWPGIKSTRFRIKYSLYAKPVHGRFLGVYSTVHVYFDPDLAERQTSELLRAVEIMETELSRKKELTEKTAKRHRHYFDLDLNGDDAFIYSKNFNKIDEAAKRFGFFCLLSNADLDGKEILSIYRRKDVIENNFVDIKNYDDVKLARTDYAAAVEGKLFCSFISLIVAAEIGETLRETMAEKSWSKDDVISELEKIRLITASENRREMNPMTKTQKLIFEKFDLDETDLLAYLSRG